MTGREKCELLKRIRAKIAADNGIKGFEYKPCTSTGECYGTCPACDAEALNLQYILEGQGININVPRNPNMPKDLIGVMDDQVYSDMHMIAERHVFHWDYDDVDVGRMITRQSYDKEADSDKHMKYPKIVVRPNCTVGIIHRERDWEKLDEDAVKRKKKRKAKHTKIKNRKNKEPENKVLNDDKSNMQKKSWFVVSEPNDTVTSEFDDKDALKQMEVVNPVNQVDTNTAKSKKRRQKEHGICGNIAVRTQHTYKDKSNKTPRGLLNLFKKKDGDKK